MRRSSTPRGEPSARTDVAGSPTTGAVRYDRGGASRWTIGFEPAAPRARRPRPRVTTLRPSPEDSVADRPTDPDLERDFARLNGWDVEHETWDDFELPTYVGPLSFMKLPWVTDPAELRRR